MNMLLGAGLGSTEGKAVGTAVGRTDGSIAGRKEGVSVGGTEWIIVTEELTDGDGDGIIVGYTVETTDG